MNQKKYERILAQIETRITDLGLNGKIARLSVMNNINEVVSRETKNKVKTIIAVGNDQTVNKIVNAMIDCQVPLGIIPIGKENNNIAQALGIDFEEAACEILSARRITKIDVGLANNTYFLLQATIVNQNTTLEISQNYSIEIADKGETQIINLLSPNINLPIKTRINPQDGLLELFIKTKATKNIFNQAPGYSILQIKKVLIKNTKFPVVLDNITNISSPVEISLLKQKLSVIVGRNRNF
ncbi:MAG: diacylglycerol kinase family protein [bacterium]|nr:diacylglycerol kinase family protein [bacterium]